MNGLVTSCTDSETQTNSADLVGASSYPLVAVVTMATHQLLATSPCVDCKTTTVSCLPFLNFCLDRMWAYLFSSWQHKLSYVTWDACWSVGWAFLCMWPPFPLRPTAQVWLPHMPTHNHGTISWSISWSISKPTRGIQSWALTSIWSYNPITMSYALNLPCFTHLLKLPQQITPVILYKQGLKHGWALVRFQLRYCPLKLVAMLVTLRKTWEMSLWILIKTFTPLYYTNETSALT